MLAEKAVAALGIEGGKAESYGKAAAVGENGELEHAAAILHPKLGAPVRKALTKGAALIPSSKKRGGPGVALDIPLGHKDAAFVRSHFDGMEVRIADAPRANEIMVAVAVTDSGRPLPRVGGLEERGDQGRRWVEVDSLLPLQREKVARSGRMREVIAPLTLPSPASGRGDSVCSSR